MIRSHVEMSQLRAWSVGLNLRLAESALRRRLDLGPVDRGDVEAANAQAAAMFEAEILRRGLPFDPAAAIVAEHSACVLLRELGAITAGIYGEGCEGK